MATRAMTFCQENMIFEPRLYYCDVEFEFASSHPEFERLAGGSTFVFAMALDARLAIAQIENKLRRENLKVICIDYVTLYEGVKWDDDEQQHRYDLLAEEAKSSGKAVLDDLWGYENLE